VGSNYLKLWIAICGIDGVGKTTLACNLKEYLSLHRIPVNYAKVPFPSKEACLSANFSYCDISQEVVKRVGMAFDFVRYYSSISKLDGIVICDRFAMDYEALDDIYNLPQNYCDLLQRLYNLIPPPDLFIHLKVSVDEAIYRLEKRGDKAFDESNEILIMMDKYFDTKFRYLKNVLKIDASQSQQKILDIALCEILNLWEINHD